MNSKFRTVVAIATALILILGPFGWAYQFKRSFRAKYAKLVRDAAIAEGNTAAAKMSDAELLTDLGMQLPEDELTRLMICDSLFAFWWIWTLLVMALCYGLFVLLGRGSPPGNST